MKNNIENGLNYLTLQLEYFKTFGLTENFQNYGFGKGGKHFDWLFNNKNWDKEFDKAIILYQNENIKKRKLPEVLKDKIPVISFVNLYLLSLEIIETKNLDPLVFFEKELNILLKDYF